MHHGSDGNEVTFYGEYLETQAPDRIAWTFNFDDTTGGPETYTFEEVFSLVGFRQHSSWTPVAMARCARS